MASSVPGRAWGEPHMALPLQDLMGHMKPAEVTDSNTDGDTAKSLLTIVSWKSLGIIQPNPCSLTGTLRPEGWNLLQGQTDDSKEAPIRAIAVMFVE